MNGIIDTKKHLDSNFAIEQSKFDLKSLRIDVAFSQAKNEQTIFNKIHNRLQVNNFFLYYLAYIAIGLMITIV